MSDLQKLFEAFLAMELETIETEIEYIEEKLRQLKEKQNAIINLLNNLND